MANIVHWGKYYPPDMGGIEVVTSSLASGSAAAGHDVTVVCFNKTCEPANQTMDGVRVIRVPESALVASQPLGLRYLLSVLREARRADIVHLHVPNMLGALAALILSKRRRLLVHWHSDIVGKGALGRIVRPLERAMLRRANRIVCTSQDYAEGSNALRPFLHKVGVVPIGVPDPAAPTVARATLPPALAAKVAGRRIVLAIGRMVPYKGFGVLVEASSLLPDDAVVLIVGCGPMKVELQASIDLRGLRHKVLLTGRLDDAALNAVYRNATLYCLPSVARSEAFGVVLLEAMAHGLPIVATRIIGSGVPWVNKHDVSGLNVSVGDPSGLADAIMEILGSELEHSKYSSGARMRYETLFTETASTNRMLYEYSQLMGIRNKEKLMPSETSVSR